MDHSNIHITRALHKQQENWEERGSDQQTAIDSHKKMHIVSTSMISEH
jgi:hypothetical protein